MSGDSHRLKLTDFMDLGTLQEIQDRFAAVANVRAVVTDAEGNLLTQPGPNGAELAVEHVAPIVVNDQQLGTLRMSRADGDAIQFLSLIANAIARSCFQEYQLRQRINELSAVTTVAAMLADARDLNQLLQRTAQVVCEVMQVRASSIRLIDREQGELVTKAVWNLSSDYLNKGPILFTRAMLKAIDASEQGYEYVPNVRLDPRSTYPGEAQREGIVSLLSVVMRHKGEAIGLLRIYTEEEQTFAPHQVNLLKAIAAQAAAAIENARLANETAEAERLEHQVRLAAEVQLRMLPAGPPEIAKLEIASLYVPTHELGGDFYDFWRLPDDNLGLVVADVSGKGLPASLTMASVRASLRSQVDNLYYLYEAVSRVNFLLHRDVKVGEFVTLFYGVLDAPNRRLTYCNAGHPPPMLLRSGEVSDLRCDNMVLGVNPEEEFVQSILHLETGDVLLLFTDGLCDAMNFQGETFGAARLREALRASSGNAETIASNVLWHMRRFAGLTTRTDDITMVVVKVQ